MIEALENHLQLTRAAGILRQPEETGEGQDPYAHLPELPPDDAYIGARVVCVRPGIVTELKVGDEHTLAEVKLENGEYYVRCLGYACFWWICRFRLIPPEPLTPEDARKLCLNDTVRLVSHPKEERHILNIYGPKEEVRFFIRGAGIQDYHQLAKA